MRRAERYPYEDQFKPMPGIKTPFGTLTAWMAVVLFFGIFMPIIGLEHYYGGYVMGHDDTINPHHRQSQLHIAKMLFAQGLVSVTFLLLALNKPVKRILDALPPGPLFVFLIVFVTIAWGVVSSFDQYLK